MSGWFVVVTRMALDLETSLSPYVIGPYGTAGAAMREANSDEGVVQGLLKAEEYVAGECFWTLHPPRGGEYILP